MTVHLTERVKALEPFGWTARRAEWIALACLHGGVFTRAQGKAFLCCHHEEYGSLQAALKRSIALEKQAHGRAGQGLMHRTATWQTARLMGAYFRWWR